MLMNGVSYSLLNRYVMYKISLRVWTDSTRKDYEFKEFFLKDLSKLASLVQQYDFKSISVEPIVFVD